MEPTELCAICASVDFEKAIDDALTVDTYKLVPRYTLHDYHTLDSKCPLCQIFLAIVHDWGDDQRDDATITVVASSNPRSDYSYNDFKIPWIDFKMPMLHIRTPTLPYELRRDLYWQRVDAKVIHPVSATIINFDAIKVAIQLCRETHSTCQKSKSVANPFFKLIDCVTRKVVLANAHPDDDYAALSYVWGQSHHELKHIGALPQSLPATIEDAIKVVHILGLKYLWIDRYCIDQDDAVELSSQIGSMDAIYHNAAITIIAACGEDPSYGLPRVNSGSQEQNETLEFTIGNLQFFPPQSQHNGKSSDKIYRSRWMTRAWTYQEAVFSRLRLFFTEDEVYLDCHEAQGQEFLNFKDAFVRKYSPLPTLYHGKKNGQLEVFSLYHSKRKGQLEVFQHIFEYSERSLSRPEDVIRALTGILHAFEVDRGVTHHWGIPILKQHPNSSKSKWGSVEAFFLGLQWLSFSSPQRRVFAPSWSWAGWEGRIDWSMGHDIEFTVDPQARFRVELLDGRVLDWEELLAYDMTTRPSLVSKFVHLTAPSISVRIKPSSRFSLFAKVWTAQPQFPKDGQDMTFEFKSGFSSKVESFPGACEAIHLGYHKYTSRVEVLYPSLLIVGERNGRMERMGIAKISVNTDNTTPESYPQVEAEQFERYNQMMRNSLKTTRIG